MPDGNLSGSLVLRRYDVTVGYHPSRKRTYTQVIHRRYSFSWTKAVFRLTMSTNILALAGFVTAVTAKATGPPRYGPHPTVSAAFSYGTFTYDGPSSSRYATPLPSPLSASTTYAPPFSSASGFLDPDITYTTYSLRPNATATNDGKYGQSAYAALWASANLTYSDHPPFTTTRSATAVPSTELVYPPALPLVPADVNDTTGLMLPSDFVWGVASSAWQIEGGLIAGWAPVSLSSRKTC